VPILGFVQLPGGNGACMHWIWFIIAKALEKELR